VWWSIYFDGIKKYYTLVSYGSQCLLELTIVIDIKYEHLQYQIRINISKKNLLSCTALFQKKKDVSEGQTSIQKHLII
jgi:hypothetical protein